jgi:hypothetical protein
MTQPKKPSPQPYEDRVLAHLLAMPPQPKIAAKKAKKPRKK